MFLVAALLFVLTAMTYVEGASLHQDRGGSTVFARYAFNELVSFVAGWAILLDYVILIAVTAFSATQYLRVVLEPARALAARRSGWRSAFIALVVLSNIRGFGDAPRAAHRDAAWPATSRCRCFIVVLGLVLFFNPHTLLDPIHLGSAPSWSDLIFALTIAAISFTSLESASGLAGEVRISRRGLKRLVCSAHRDGRASSTWASRWSPSPRCRSTAGTPNCATRYLNAPMIGVVAHVHPHWLAQTLKYLVAALAAVTLVAAANSAMLGLSRLAYSLSTNRQIPSGLGRLHPQRSTPYVLIIARRACSRPGSSCPRTSTSWSASTPSARCSRSRSRTCRSAGCATREPDRDRPYRMPLSVTRPRRRAAAAGGVRRARLRRGLGRRDDRARARALRRARLDGVRHRRSTWSTAAPMKPRCCAA